MINFATENGKPYPLGASFVKEGVQFALESESKDCGVILIHKKSKEKLRIPFSFKPFGKIYSVIIKNFDFDKYNYNFYSGDEEFADPYANLLTGNEKFGAKGDGYKLEGKVVNHSAFDWKGDVRPLTDFSESVFYLLHVRGFSAHSSSKVAHKGTVDGIVEKIPYLKDLGVTGVELMPSYEFEEYVPADLSTKAIAQKAGGKVIDKINYWGFKEAFYYAPKASFCYSADPVADFKNFVLQMHKNSLEVIMQFYFPDKYKAHFIYDVIKFWLINYHIDGFHLKGNNIPFSLIANDPLFSDTKLFYDYIPENEVYEAQFVPKKKNLCVYSDAFMYQMRKALKGDEDTLKDIVYFTKNMPEKSACVNFITNYYGFTLNDLVSYDRKHNDDNGERNLDGCDYNYSWNCGIEGKSKKASIVKLRTKMMKNALFLVMASKGTPLILAGDELCNTQNGNNNPYCQDNSVSYINWNKNALSDEIFEYTKNLIALRKSCFLPLLERDFTMLDRLRIGFPDLSYHSDEAWRAGLATYNRHMGIMYSDYDKSEDLITLLFVAYNFYWKDITFALPFVPGKAKWENIFSTGSVKNVKEENNDNSQGEKFEIEQRSCAVFKVTFKKNTDKKEKANK